MTQRGTAGSANLFHALVENSSDAIALLCPDGTLTYASQTTSRVLGYSADELVGTNAFDLVHPDDQEATRANFAQALAQPDVAITGVWRHRHKSGEWRAIEGIGVNRLADPDIAAIVLNFRPRTSSSPRWPKTGPRSGWGRTSSS